MSTYRYMRIATPFADLTVVCDEHDVVVASGFADLPAVADRVAELNGASLVEQDVPRVRAAVDSWLAGDPRALEQVATRQSGGEFMQRAWAELTKIPAGAVVSYQELAELSGSAKAVRAAGTACSSNKVAPFVPCHRVVKTGGALGNYGFGVDVKQRLLAFELPSEA